MLRQKCRDEKIILCKHLWSRQSSFLSDSCLFMDHLNLESLVSKSLRNSGKLTCKTFQIIIEMFQLIGIYICYNYLFSFKHHHMHIIDVLYCKYISNISISNYIKFCSTTRRTSFYVGHIYGKLMRLFHSTHYACVTIQYWQVEILKLSENSVKWYMNGKFNKT